MLLRVNIVPLNCSIVNEVGMNEDSVESSKDCGTDSQGCWPPSGAVTTGIFSQVLRIVTTS